MPFAISMLWLKWLLADLMRYHQYRNSPSCMQLLMIINGICALICFCCAFNCLVFLTITCLWLILKTLHLSSDVCVLVYTACLFDKCSE